MEHLGGNFRSFIHSSQDDFFFPFPSGLEKHCQALWCVADDGGHISPKIVLLIPIYYPSNGSDMMGAKIFFSRLQWEGLTNSWWLNSGFWHRSYAKKAYCELDGDQPQFSLIENPIKKSSKIKMTGQRITCHIADLSVWKWQEYVEKYFWLSADRKQ